MSDRIDALERLAKLREQGALTQQEYDAEKANLIGPRDRSMLDNGPERNEIVDEKPKRLALTVGGLALIGAIGLGIIFATTSTFVRNSKPTPTATNTELSQTGGGEGPRLSALLKFENASECEPAEALRVLLDDLRSLEPNREPTELAIGGQGGKAAVTTSRIESGAGEGSVISELIAPGAWGGLKVAGIRTIRFADDTGHAFEIRFSDPVEKVRRSLNADGFEIPKAGELRNVDLDSGAGLSLGVETVEGGGSALLCARSNT